MLIRFSVANFRSINERCEFSMVASKSISDKPLENMFEVEDNRLLKYAVIYGANSSGKSNVLLAIDEMKQIVMSSVRLNDGDELRYDPFLFSSNNESSSLFEVEFILDGSKYRYGFELDAENIISEWLYKSSLRGKKAKELFYRELAEIEFDSKLFAEGKPFVKKVNSNRLFLSLCAQLGGDESKKVMSWFQQGVNVISGLSTEEYAMYSKMMLHKKLNGCERAESFFKNLQLGFTKLESVETEFNASLLPNEIPENVKEDLIKKNIGKKQIDLNSVHNVYNSKGEVIDNISLNINRVESEGTKKLIEFSGPIFDTLHNGKVLVIDELDAKLHPLISQHIIRLFNDPVTNPYNAQLIFSTHDTHLLSSGLFRRDQIWFTEKDKKEQTDLYSLKDVVLPDGSKPRNDANYEKNYVAGRYGAVPYIINY